MRIHYGFNRSTVRFDDAKGEDGDRLVECLEQGFAVVIERAESDPGAHSGTSWVERHFEASPLVREFDRVRGECFNEMIDQRTPGPSVVPVAEAFWVDGAY